MLVNCEPKGLISKLGKKAVDEFERLYLLPGVNHCGGGEGPGNLDLLTPMMSWVEMGQAPDAIITTSSAEKSSFGQPDFANNGGDGHMGPPPQRKLDVTPLPPMSRPIYPYPYTAKYVGTGDVTNTQNWTKGDGAPIVSVYDWPGKDFFGPYKQDAE